jgi:hypothetical protein
LTASLLRSALTERQPDRWATRLSGAAPKRLAEGRQGLQDFFERFCSELSNMP